MAQMRKELVDAMCLHRHAHTESFTLCTDVSAPKACTPGMLEDLLRDLQHDFRTRLRVTYVTGRPLRGPRARALHLLVMPQGAPLLHRGGVNFFLLSRVEVAARGPPYYIFNIVFFSNDEADDGEQVIATATATLPTLTRVCASWKKVWRAVASHPQATAVVFATIVLLRRRHLNTGNLRATILPLLVTNMNYTQANVWIRMMDLVFENPTQPSKDLVATTLGKRYRHCLVVNSDEGNHILQEYVCTQMAAETVTWPFTRNVDLVCEEDSDGDLVTRYRMAHSMPGESPKPSSHVAVVGRYAYHFKEDCVRVYANVPMPKMTRHLQTLYHASRHHVTVRQKLVSLYELSKQKFKSLRWTHTVIRCGKKPVNLFLQREVEECFTTSLRRFVRSHDEYVKNGFAYHKGYILHGPPGTGKTTCVKTLAGELDLPIFDFDIGKVVQSCQEDHLESDKNHAKEPMDYESDRMAVEVLAKLDGIEARIRAMSNNQPHIVLMEDVDTTNIMALLQRHPSVVHFFLKMLDGVNESSGRITVMTANSIDRLKDLSSLTRKGRINHIVKLDYLDMYQLANISDYYFQRPVPTAEFVLSPSVCPTDVIQLVQTVLIDTPTTDARDPHDTWVAMLVKEGLLQHVCKGKDTPRATCP